jgi:thiol-disulfide isomerase/thioredoxin
MRNWRLLAVAAVLAWSSSSSSAEELRAFVRGSWNDILAAHAGRPTVIHFWGLTCGPCRTEMPQWGRLLAERSDLNLVAIDADLVPNEAGTVLATLVQTGLGAAENWMFRDPFVERLRFEIDPGWAGEIPRTMLIAGDGTVTAIDGTADLDAVRAWLDLQRAAQNSDRR